ncbi:MAG: S9 family peptidase [Acidobacteriota bacterium]
MVEPAKPGTGAQSAEGGDRLTVERIYGEPEGGKRELRAKSYGPARWLERSVDGSQRLGLTTVETSDCDCGGKDIVWIDAESGEREVLVSAERLIPEGAEKPLGIDGYQWSSDGKRLLLFTNAQRVWRQKTRGDYWVVGLDSESLWQVGADFDEATLMFAKLSPNAERVAFVQTNDLYVQDVGQAAGARALTERGSRTLIHGTFDWVYEEEFSLRDGFRWSPDGQSIAFWQLDASGIEDFYLINNTDELYPQLQPIPYPKVGTQNSACRLGIVSVEGGAPRWIEVGDDLRDHYIARMDWLPQLEGEGAGLIFQRLNRLQNRNEVTLANAGSGEVDVWFTESDDAWLDVVDTFEWLPTDDGEAAGSLIWLSERSGHRHVYRADRGEQPVAVTSGDFDVVSIEQIDAEGGHVYFMASPGSATQRYLYRAPLTGGASERLSPDSEPGTHSYQISPKARYAVHTYSAFGRPPKLSMVELPSHRTLRVLEGNEALRGKLGELTLGAAEFFRVPIDDGVGGTVELDAWRILPPDFDETLEYPLIFHVYGEPAGQTVLDRWGGDRFLWHQMLAQRGYIVVSVDNRGTPAPRGREWRKMVYGQIGILAVNDQAAAAREILEWPYVDAARVAIWGWSGGGSMTLNMLFRHPEIYGTGISIAPVSDQLLYDTIYQERYMGLPEGNPDGFRDGSPIHYAEGLEGNLLLIHGTADDNVHYQSAERLINRLIELGKPFDMMSYPNRTHAIREGKGTSRHLFELMTRYIEEHVPAGSRRP